MKMKQIKIDRQRCTGCGSCVVLALDAFVLDLDNAKAKIKSDWRKTPSEDLLLARDSCPVQAIIIEEG